MLEIIFFGTALIATIAGIALFRRHGLAVGTLDVPNERSSHTLPTLRGGGLVIVLVCLSLYFAVSFTGAGEINWSFVFGAVIVAAVSWIDDKYSLPAWVKFIAHSASAAVLIAGSSPLTGIFVPAIGQLVLHELILQVFAFFWVVWMINAYNFMDGIDGIAGAQGVVAGIGWAAVSLWTGDGGTYLLAGVIVFACLGFLFHNWSPAHVFMGDVGSAFLGYTFAALPLIAQKTGDESRWLLTAAASFVWLFVFDTVFTFVRRVLKGEKVWIAHRQHLYQTLVILGWGHGAVSAMYAGLTLLLVAAFLAAFTLGGIAEPLLLLTYIALPAAVIFLVFRKKVDVKDRKC